MNSNFSFKYTALILALTVSLTAPPTWAQTVQEKVHHMSPMVMPFDMTKTLHIFKMTEHGGVLQVIVRQSRWKAQVPLIQQHLKHEAMQFQKGNYADPATLHGTDMPGLKDLTQGAASVKVSYQDLPNGGVITFETTSLHLQTAIHRWFGAQLSEHGADAKTE